LSVYTKFCTPSIVDDFEKEHPAELGQALRITIDTSVFSHDVLDGFDGISG